MHCKALLSTALLLAACGSTNGPAGGDGFIGSGSDLSLSGGNPDSSGGADLAGVFGDGCFPPCFGQIVRPCLGMGTCSSQTVPNASGSVTTQCFSNGVKDISTIDTANMMDTVQVFLNGALCYSWTQPVGGGGSSITLTYFDANGTFFASETIGSSTTIECGGLTYSFDSSIPACQAVYPNGVPTCSDGACS
jgi:hypothetical protein